MMDNHLLVRAIREANVTSIVAASLDVLRSAVDFREALQGAYDGIDPDRLHDQSHRYTVPDIEPKVFVLHDDPGFQLVLNHFDRAAFDHHRRAGRITPHFHQFAFSSRILVGGYYHVVYRNKSELLTPSLEVRHHHSCGAGTVYSMMHDWYHCVFEPIDGTLSLMIRGPVVVPVPSRADSHRYSRNAFHRDWCRVGEAIKRIDAAPTQHVELS